MSKLNKYLEAVNKEKLIDKIENKIRQSDILLIYRKNLSKNIRKYAETGDEKLLSKIASTIRGSGIPYNKIYDMISLITRLRD